MQYESRSYVNKTIGKMKTSDMIHNNGKQSEELASREASTFANCLFVSCNINLVNN